MINYFKAAEKVLSERGNLERALENITRRKERILKQGGPSELSGVDYSKTYVSTAAAGDALSACLELAEVIRELGDTEGTIAEIDRVLEQLDKADADLLRAWYIGGKSKDEIAADLAYSSKTSIYDLRNKAVSEFAILYYGAGALASV